MASGNDYTIAWRFDLKAPDCVVAFLDERIRARECYIGISKSFLVGEEQGVRASSRLAKAFGLALAVAAAGVFATGCETGRTNKLHSEALRINDVTTTGKQDPNYAANGDGIPPVPGSPTAAGADGKQPYNSADARPSPGSELGDAAPPGEQKKDPFIRQ